MLNSVSGAVRWGVNRILLPVRVLVFTAACCTASFPGMARTAAEEFTVAPLTDDEQQAIAAISEKDVLSTVAFLASDEMAGRSTPSTELNIAAAYVAARFRGAGLEGLGPDGSFYQTENLPLVGPPVKGVELRVGDAGIVGVRALMGMPEAVAVEGIPVDGSVADARFDGPVWVDETPLPPQASGSAVQVLAMWSRRVRQLTEQGARAVLIRTADDSVLWDVARELAEDPVALPARFGFDCPVLLIPQTAPLDQVVHLNIPPRVEVQVPVHNVIGVLRGSDPELSQEAVIITAHLDHIGLSGRGDDPVNNGADDNATGVTAVVTLADAFSALKERPARSVVFMTFWGEEKGLLGSKHYAQHPLWPLDRTIANINIEMIGRPENGAEGKAWGTGWTRSSLGPQMAAGAARADVMIFHHEAFSEMLYARSDNYSFVNVGVIAHSFSAGSLHDDYHQPTDEVARLNIPHMTQVIQGLFAGSLPIARGALTPVATGN